MIEKKFRLNERVVHLIEAQNAGTTTVIEPRDAASVVLIRAGETSQPGGVEVHLMRRKASMAFAAGMLVFVGGGVDPSDFDSGEPDAAIAWAGPSVTDWARLLDVDEARARALVCAAVRETFEESGVLLASDSDGHIIADTAGDLWEEQRRQLEAHELSLADLLRIRGLTLRSDLLTFWSRWTTPTFETRRYATWFFAAEVPAGQGVRDVSTESVQSQWMSIAEVLRTADAGTMLVLPPQYCTCLEMYEYPTTDELLGAHRETHNIQPAPQLDEDGAYLSLPRRLSDLAHTVARALAADPDSPAGP